jgi:hypothetical protein
MTRSKTYTPKSGSVLPFRHGLSFYLIFWEIIDFSKLAKARLTVVIEISKVSSI